MGVARSGDGGGAEAGGGVSRPQMGGAKQRVRRTEKKN